MRFAQGKRIKNGALGTCLGDIKPIDSPGQLGLSPSPFWCVDKIWTR